MRRTPIPRIRAANGDDSAGAQSVCEVAAEGGDRDVGKKIGIVDRGRVRPGEPQVADHLRQDHAIADANRVIDEEIDEDSCENDPGPVKGSLIFHPLPSLAKGYRSAVNCRRQNRSELMKHAQIQGPVRRKKLCPVT